MLDESSTARQIWYSLLLGLVLLSQILSLRNWLAIRKPFLQSARCETRGAEGVRCASLELGGLRGLQDEAELLTELLGQSGGQGLVPVPHGRCCSLLEHRQSNTLETRHSLGFIPTHSSNSIKYERIGGGRGEEEEVEDVYRAGKNKSRKKEWSSTCMVSISSSGTVWIVDSVCLAARSSSLGFCRSFDLSSSSSSPGFCTSISPLSIPARQEEDELLRSLEVLLRLIRLHGDVLVVLIVLVLVRSGCLLLVRTGHVWKRRGRQRAAKRVIQRILTKTLTAPNRPDGSPTDLLGSWSFSSPGWSAFSSSSIFSPPSSVSSSPSFCPSSFSSWAMAFSSMSNGFSSEEKEKATV
ncbi:hypothetical protein EYF80_004385 [Liparis tanakae]|uniref:Transmembrane protein n=1 Tax=Liparis tanakae TaxID=230148 RepID=A0A4Z2J717_9TELE|nr:hypothetical protein EYF80_004385 [Liparis tanakae]